MRRFALLLMASLTLGACGPRGRGEPERFPISGTVTLDGKPLPQGVVYFKTVATGAIDSATIKDGKFQGKAEAGDRRVEISAHENRSMASPADNPTSPTNSPRRGRNLVPPRYNVESVLTATVTRDGPNEFPFSLKSK